MAHNTKENNDSNLTPNQRETTEEILTPSQRETIKQIIFDNIMEILPTIIKELTPSIIDAKEPFFKIFVFFALNDPSALLYHEEKLFKEGHALLNS